MKMPAMDGGSEESGAFAAPPPLGGLGNYKGVMLCNRPSEGDGRAGHGDGEGFPPFKSTISATAREQIGLTPCTKRDPRDPELKTRGSSAALRRHVRWIKDLQEQIKDDQRRSHDDTKAVEDRKQQLQVVFKQQRDAIRELKAAKGYDIEPRQLEAILKPSAAKSGKNNVQKPLWAMTEKENEEFDEEEAADLIRFAEDVDFDKYITDLEFRNCMKVVKDRAHKLQKEQDAFKDAIVRQFNAENDDGEGSCGDYTDDYNADGASVYAGSSASRQARSDAGGRQPRQRRPDWDGSTVCGDDESAVSGAARGARAAADEVLETNSQMRAVHSKASVQRLVEKMQDRDPS